MRNRLNNGISKEIWEDDIKHREEEGKEKKGTSDISSSKLK